MDNQEKLQNETLESSEPLIAPFEQYCFAGKPQDNSDRIEALLGTVDQTEIVELTKHARYRLERVALSPDKAQDLVQDALLAVILGMTQSKTGRHPLERDLVSRSAFFLYLRGVVNSLVEAVRRRREHSIIHEPLRSANTEGHEPIGLEIPAPQPAEADVSVRDDVKVLFQLLRRSPPDHLQPLIEAWEPEALSVERIPIPNACRRDRWELRRLAKRVLDEMNQLRKRP